MCETSSWGLEPRPLPPNTLTNIYTYRMTTASKICGGKESAILESPEFSKETGC